MSTKAYEVEVTVTQKKPFGRSLSDFGSLKPAEEKLLKACRLGRMEVCGDAVPESPTNENCVRAGFLRFLLLGGDEQSPVHEQGVVLKGAYVEGVLNLNSCNVPGNILLSKCNFSRGIYAQDANVGGVISLSGSYLASVLKADRLKCASGVFLNSGFKAMAEVRLMGAHIGGNFECNGGHFNTQANENVNSEATNELMAIAADGVNVAGDVLLGSGFEAYGEVRLPGAKINGDLNCEGGLFDGKTGDAFFVGRTQIKGSVFLCEGFIAKGMVILSGSRIGSELFCDGGRFEVDIGVALFLDGADVVGDVHFGQPDTTGSSEDAKDGKCDPFHATGMVSLVGMKIGGELNCDKGQFHLSKNRYETENDCALDISFAVVRRAWKFKCKGVRVNASHAQVGVLQDDLVAWAQGSSLDGFRYGAFGRDASTGGQGRIEWLCGQKDQDLRLDKFCPQPWRQLQRVLREMGHIEDAKLVGIAFEDHLRKIGRMGEWPKDPCDVLRDFKGMLTRTAHYIFGKLAGYGYRPVNLVMWMFAVWLLCGGIYWALAQPQFNAIAPSDPLIFNNPRYSQCLPIQDNQVEKLEPAEGKYTWPNCSILPGEYSTFSPIFYSLDILLPVVDLGQENAWGAYIPSSTEDMVEKPIWDFRWGYLVRVVAWFETLFGWVSSLLLVAIISGFSRRNDED